MRTSTIRKTVTITSLTAFALTVAACGSDDKTAASSTTTSTSTTSTSSSSTTSASSTETAAPTTASSTTSADATTSASTTASAPATAATTAATKPANPATTPALDVTLNPSVKGSVLTVTGSFTGSQHLQVTGSTGAPVTKAQPMGTALMIDGETVWGSDAGDTRCTAKGSQALSGSFPTFTRKLTPGTHKISYRVGYCGAGGATSTTKTEVITVS